MVGLLGVGLLSVLRAQTGAEAMSISRRPDGVVVITWPRPLGSSGVIEATEDLSSESWVTLGTGTAINSDGLVRHDPLATQFPRRFYRGRDLAGIWATTSAAFGLRNAEILIPLDGVDTDHPGAVLTATVMQLPATGALYQVGPANERTLITAVPAIVQDSNRRVAFVPEQDASGVPYTAFRYSVKTNVAGQDNISPVGNVTVNVLGSASPPVADLAPIEATEDTEQLIQLAYNLTAGGQDDAAILVFIASTPSVGTLYQVEADNVTRGAPITEVNTLVTNPNHLVIYVPPPDLNGTPLTSFTYYIQDAYGQFSNTESVPINITAVNDPPVATATDHTSYTDVYLAGLSLQFFDPDGTVPYTVHFTAIDPAIEIYSDFPISPENRVLPGMEFPNLNFYRFRRGGPQNYATLSSYGSPYGTFSYYVTDKSGAASEVVTDTINIELRDLFPDPTLSPASASAPVNGEQLVVLRALDRNPGGNSNNLDFYIRKHPDHGFLTLPNGFVIPKTNLNFPLPPSNPTVGWKVVYHPDPGFSNDVNNPDTFGYAVTNEDDLEYPLPLFVNLYAPAQAPPSGMLAWWRGQETATDTLGNHDGTLEGGLGFAPGKAGMAFSFDGVDDSFLLSGSATPLEWTVAVWVNRQDSPDNSAALLTGATSALKLEQFGSATRNVGLTSFGVADYTFNYSAPVGTWVHLAFVKSGLQTLLYVNGELADTLSAIVDLPFTRIGGPTSDRLKGQLDEVQVFSRALSASEVAAIYNTGEAGLALPGP